MLNRLVQFALAQRLFVVLTAILLAGFGWFAFRALPIDAFPDVSSTQVKIIMKAPGMTPEEIESRIAVPIEVEMLGIPQQRMLRSVTKYGLVDVTVDFQDGGASIPGCSAVALSGGGNTPSAVCSTSSLSVGTHNIVAVYAVRQQEDLHFFALIHGVEVRRRMVSVEHADDDSVKATEFRHRQSS